MDINLNIKSFLVFLLELILFNHFYYYSVYVIKFIFYSKSNY